MKSEEYTKLFEIEQNNWWYKSRRRLINNYLRDNFVPKQSRLILDVATAAGTNLFEFNRFGKIIGIDIAQESLKICQSRNIKDLICGDAMNLPFANNSFDMVFAFDALEHFSDDHKTVSGFYDTLKPQGKLLITAPAFMALWSEHDEAFHHFRRYKKMN